MKKILILSTGGTISSVSTEAGLVPQDINHLLLDSIIDTDVELFVKSIMVLDSSNIQPEEWKVIATNIYENLNSYDGIIVTHGTDTMAYSSSMISFMVQNPNIPVVFTGSQLPILHPLTDAVDNLRCALAMAKSGVKGIFLAFNRRILFGCRSVKARTSSFDAFETINFREVGTISATKIAAGFMFGHNMGGTVTDAYIDIAYFAVCDSWEEIESVVGDEKVILTDWKNNTSDKKLSSKGELPVDTKGDDAAKVIFTKTGNKIQIYLRSPDAEKYTRYDFLYMENAARSFASWKLESIEICDSNLNKLFNTMVGDSTECEGALQERYSDGSLAADFIGGYHGDEMLKKITVLIDGIEIDMSKDYDLTVCESVQTIVESELFSCDTSNKVFDRVRTNTWTKDGLEIKNKYTATAKVTINRPETSMLAISLDYGEYEGLITEHWDNVHNEWIEIGEFTESAGKYSASGMTEAKMRGILNVSVSAYDCTFNGQALTPTGHFSYNYFSDDNMRVKIYIAPFSNRTFAVGDVFECTSFQSVFAAE